MYPKLKKPASKKDIEKNEEEAASLIDPVPTGSIVVEIGRSDLPPAPVTMISYSSRVILKNVIKILFRLILKLWKWASSFAIVIFFASWYYGGILPYIVCLVALLSLSYHISDTMLYQPETPLESRILVPSPSSHKLPYEAVYIHTPDRVKLHAYLLKQDKPRTRPVIIYFHGNAGNIGHRLDNAKQMYHVTKANILMVEYRGYGLSEGSPSEAGFYLDAQSSFEYVQSRDDLNASNVILFGRSLGGAVAIDLAARCDFRDRIRALIVENTFTSVPDLAKHLFPIRAISFLPRWCYKSRYESMKKISSVVCPTLFLSGAKDELIPPRMMTDLHGRCASNEKKLAKFPEGTHNDTWTGKGYYESISKFLQQLPKSTQDMPTRFDPYKDNIV